MKQAHHKYVQQTSIAFLQWKWNSHVRPTALEPLELEYSTNMADSNEHPNCCYGRIITNIL